MSRKATRLTQPRRGRLRDKIIGWSFVPTAIILSAVALVTFYAYQRVAEDLVIARDREVTRLSAGQLSNELSQYVNLLSALARTPDLYGTDPQTQGQALQAARNTLVVFDGGAVLLNSQGQVVAAQPERPAILGADWSDRRYYVQMLRTPAPMFSDILPDGPDGASVVTVAVPLIGPRGEFRGILAGMFRLGSTAVSSFYGGILKLRLGESVYVVDSRGRVVYHRDIERIGVELTQTEVLQGLRSGQSDTVRTEDAQGRAMLVSYAPVPNTPWGLVIEERWEQLDRSTRIYRQFLLILLGLGVLVPALVVAVGVRRITRPIEQLTAAAQQVASGRFEQAIAAHTGDEIEELAEQFNRMSAELHESYTELEHRVAERTRELTTLNSISAVVNRSLDLEEILDDALATIMEVMDVHAGAAYRLQPCAHARPDVAAQSADVPCRDQELALIVHRGLKEEAARLIARLPIDPAAPQTSVSVAAVLRQEPVVWTRGDYAASNVQATLDAEGLRWTVGVPLMSKGQVLGALTLASRHEQILAPEARDLLAAIGQQIGVAVENSRLYERAEEAAASAERSRLARDLHDAVTQTLFSASLIADVLPRLWERNPAQAQQRLEELRQLTRGALAEMRTLLLELRPTALLEAHLPDLLRQLGEAFNGRTRVPIQIDLQGECHLTAEQQVALYRIAQEALNNIAKHAAATAVRIGLRCGAASLRMDIEDDGCGFGEQRFSTERLGLRIMRERAESIGASLSVTSEPGQGTRVEVVWPGGENYRI